MKHYSKPFIILKKLRSAVAKNIYLKLAPNGGNWRSKSLPPMLKVSTMPNGFYFANCVLVAVASTNTHSEDKTFFS
jgi:hypothetical protein